MRGRAGVSLPFGEPVIHCKHPPHVDPSSVGFADTFCRKGRRMLGLAFVGVVATGCSRGQSQSLTDQIADQLTAGRGEPMEVQAIHFERAGAQQLTCGPYGAAAPAGKNVPNLRGWFVAIDAKVVEEVPRALRAIAERCIHSFPGTDFPPVT